MTRLERFTTDGTSRERLDEIRRLCDLAFEGDFSAQDWSHAVGGSHIVAIDDGAVVAHAAVVPRLIEVAGRPFRTGYVEAVATDPARQRRGLGSYVMAETAIVVRSEYELGALSTGLYDFYGRLGWERWQGPTYVRHGSGLIRTEEEDDGVMVLRFGPSANISLTDAISCEARSVDDW